MSVPFLEEAYQALEYLHLCTVTDVCRECREPFPCEIARFLRDRRPSQDEPCEGWRVVTGWATAMIGGERQVVETMHCVDCPQHVPKNRVRISPPFDEIGTVRCYDCNETFLWKPLGRHKREHVCKK